MGHRDTDNQKKPKLVTDFEGVRIQSISAGGYHSMVQTQRGDLYATGLNKDGQLGMGNNKSKTGFTQLTCFGGVNVQRYCAGGNISIFQIDEFLPFRSNYTFPEPLGAAAKKALEEKKAGKGGKDKDGANSKRPPNDRSKSGKGGS